jgi:hypothetical protein
MDGAATRIEARGRGRIQRHRFLRQRNAVVMIEAHGRGYAQRYRFLRQRSAAKIIEAHGRGCVQRKKFLRQRESAKYIQRCTRAHALHMRIAQHDASPEDLQRLEALELVRKFVAEPEGPATARDLAAQFLTTDFVEDFKLPGMRLRCKGIQEYLSASLTRAQPKVTQVDVPLWVTRSTISRANLVQTTVEREVCFAGYHRVRIEYDVRHGGPIKGQERICMRRTAPVEHKHDGYSMDDHTTEASPRCPKRKARLGECFATLDVDGSGHLSIGEIISATKFVGVRLTRDCVQKDLAVGDQDGDGTFELHELNSIIRRDQHLESLGIGERLDRPLLFDVLPLVARTFEAHTTVEACLRDAKEREEDIAREATLQRLSLIRKMMLSPDIVAVRRAARSSYRRLTGAGRQRMPSLLPLWLQRLSVAVDESTAELAQLLDHIESRGSSEPDFEPTVLQEQIVRACAECNRQRQRLHRATADATRADSMRTGSSMAGGSSRPKPAWERFRRPHALPPMPKSASEPAMAMRTVVRRAVGPTG